MKNQHSKEFFKQIIQEVRVTTMRSHRVTRLGEPLNDRDIDNIEEKVVENNQHNFTNWYFRRISKVNFPLGRYNYKCSRFQIDS